MPRLTLKEKTTLVLLAEGVYNTPEFLLKASGAAKTGWSHRIFECGLIRSWGGALYGLEWAAMLTEKGREAYCSLSVREVYQAKDRLRRIGYHFKDDPLESF